LVTDNMAVEDPPSTFYQRYGLEGEWKSIQVYCKWWERARFKSISSYPHRRYSYKMRSAYHPKQKLIQTNRITFPIPDVNALQPTVS